MRARRGDRLWPAGGALAAVALLAAGWLVLIGPERRQADSLRSQTADAQTLGRTLRHRLADLRQQNLELPRYRAELVTARQALPTTAGLPDFVVELQAAGAAAGVVVTGLVVAGRPATTVATPGVYIVPMTVTVEGPIAGVEVFINQLQRVQPRAVLVSTVSVNPAGTSRSLAGWVRLTLGLQAFVGLPSGTGPAH